MLVYRVLADIILVIHFAIVLFVIFGLLLTLIGLAMRWAWVRNFWFRLAHLIAIGVVAAQTWCDVMCPLTTLEGYWRIKAGQSAYEKSFMEDWVGDLIFYDFPSWVFTLCYTVFGAVVLATFIWGPPRPPKRPRFKAAPESTTSQKTQP
jgi:hypothetical protein